MLVGRFHLPCNSHEIIYKIHKSRNSLSIGESRYRDKFYGKLAFESRMAALKMYEYGEEIEKVSKSFHCKTHRHMFLKQWGYITSMKFFLKFKIYCWIFFWCINIYVLKKQLYFQTWTTALQISYLLQCVSPSPKLYTKHVSNYPVSK